tara:strand:- start:9938 stop:10225 length:288 start_codon:yes stop_codon:yes gene_type:complete
LEDSREEKEMNEILMEMGFFLACAALLTSVITAMVYKAFQNHHDKEMRKIAMRVGYIEMACHHHNIIPLPWEIEEFENCQTKGLKKEGNVVYLKE